MTVEEISTRLASENITLEEFARDGIWPDWLGKVERVHHDHHAETKEELEHEYHVFHLPDHNLYLRTHGTKEDGKWDFYSGLTECRPVTRTITDYISC